MTHKSTERARQKINNLNSTPAILQIKWGPHEQTALLPGAWRLTKANNIWFITHSRMNKHHCITFTCTYRTYMILRILLTWGRAQHILKVKVLFHLNLWSWMMKSSRISDPTCLSSPCCGPASLVTENTCLNRARQDAAGWLWCRQHLQSSLL